MWIMKKKYLNDVKNRYMFNVVEDLTDKGDFGLARMSGVFALFDVNEQKLVTEFKYKKIYKEKNGFFKFLTLNDNYGFLNKKGKEVVAFKKFKKRIKDCYDFDEYGYAQVVGEDDKIGVINRAGKLVYSIVYDRVFVKTVRVKENVFKYLIGVLNGENVILEELKNLKKVEKNNNI